MESELTMRIAILSLDKGGGTAHCAYGFAKSMAGKAEVTCFLAGQNEMLRRFEALPCQVKAFPMKRGARSLLWSMLTGRERSGIADAIKSDMPDIVLDAGSGVWAGPVIKQLGRQIPVAQIVHDVFPHPDLRSMIDAIPGFIYGSTADVFIALSDFSFEQLVRKYPQKRCIRAKLGISLAASQINSQSVDHRRHKQLFFGRIHPYKGVETLVDAFPLAKELDSKIELTIIGPGPLGRTLRRRIVELGINLDNRYVSEDEITQAVLSHGVMVLPYTSATQSGVVAIALANGMPCVATTVGALPEQVIDGRNGLLVPPRDPQALARAMAAISTNADTARRMAAESLRVGRELYSWSVIGERLLDDLGAFLSRKTSRPS